MNFWDILLSIIILIVVVLAVIKCVHTKKNGRACCGNCTKCSGHVGKSGHRK